MLLSQIFCCRCHDCLLADYNFAILADGLPHVVFAYELGRNFT
jgi:hypothetical protein